MITEWDDEIKQIKYDIINNDYIILTLLADNNNELYLTLNLEEIEQLINKLKEVQIELRTKLYDNMKCHHCGKQIKQMNEENRITKFNFNCVYCNECQSLTSKPKIVPEGYEL